MTARELAMLGSFPSTDRKGPERAPARSTPTARWRSLLALLRQAAREASAEDERMVYVVARSPDAPAAALVLRNVAALAADGITVAGIFAQIPDRDDVGMRALAREYGVEGLRRYVRIAGFAGWREQSERVRLGRVGLHLGPSLGIRRPRLEDGGLIDLRNQPETAELARLWFSSLWAVSAPLPVSLARALAR
jgi:hypothetical protein